MGRRHRRPGRIAGGCHLDHLADLRRGRVQTQRAKLIKLFHGRFDGHHGEPTRLLLDQIDTPLVQFGNHRARIGVKLISFWRGFTANDAPDLGRST